MIYFCAVYLIWIELALLVFVWRDAIKALVAGAISRLGFVTLIRFFYHRPRPYIALHLTPLFADTSWSFPSGHASFMFAIATIVFIKNRRLGAVMYVLSILTGWGRVMAHVHWTSDIVGGAVLGILVGLGVDYLAQKIWNPRQPDTI